MVATPTRYLCFLNGRHAVLGTPQAAGLMYTSGGGHPFEGLLESLEPLEPLESHAQVTGPFGSLWDSPAQECPALTGE